MRLVRLLVAVTLVVPAACGGDTVAGNGDGSAASPKPPPGAIRVADDRYMVPRGADRYGCPSYSPWSRRSLVPAAIYYRRSDGGFTLYRSEADCGERPTPRDTGEAR